MIEKAIIIAGGLGTRICNVMGCVCKQVIRIHGIELFMFPLISLYRAGVREFYVIGNPINHHLLDKVLEKYSRLLDFKYFLDLNPYIDTYNGNTALIGLKKVDEPVFLSVSDHIYPYELPLMMSRNSIDCDVLIAGDKNPLLVDVGEATKIVIDSDQRVKRVSKKLDRYDYIDTGLFIVNNPVKITKLYNIEKPIELANIFTHKELDVKVYGFQNIMWKDIDVFDDLEYLYSSELRDVVKDIVNYIRGMIK